MDRQFASSSVGTVERMQEARFDGNQAHQIRQRCGPNSADGCRRIVR
jgi:hypothetical protein